MKNISTLTLQEIKSRLKGEGLYLRTGSFIVHLKTSIANVVEGIALLYADYPFVDQTDFADFHISLEPPRNLRRWFSRQVLFRFDGAAPFAPLPLDQALPMLEWGMNWCVSNHANSYLIIHAAVIEKDGFAAILPAPPGSGKSTLCAALVHRGWRLLSDELTLIRACDGKIMPLPRPISLKNNSIDIIQAYASDAVFSNKVSDTIKGTVALMKASADRIARATEMAHAAWIIFPQYVAGAAAQLAPLSQARAFMRVADNAFNYSLLGMQGFETLASVIDAAQCHEFTYSSLDDAVDTFARLAVPTRT